MKQAWNHILMVSLGAGLLWGSAALAKSPRVQEHEQQHDGCLGSCKQELKQCTDACKKHAGEGASLCIKACGDLNKECEQDCKTPAGKK
jgi:hypothetical protein